MASSKRKQDEKHLKMLREMAALPPNKQCFDCHQRGPTYVNMTIGSFVCTSCSGILRGLNPPHRVKSISMASFTPDEMEFLKCHGNEFCRKVYLGLYDTRSGAEPDSRDEQKVKDFMIQKYERKRYYVAPTDTMKAEAKTLNETAMNKQATTRPLKTLLGEKAQNIVIGQNEESSKLTLKSQAATVPGQIIIGQQPQKDTSFQSPGQQSQSSQSSGSATMDLLGDLGGDPFSSSASTPSQQPSTGGFADFTSFNQFGSAGQVPPQQTAFSGFDTSNNTLVPMSNTVAVSSSLTNGSTSQQPVSVPNLTGGDKYSALSDLFSSSPVSTGVPVPAVTNVNWGGGSSSDASWGGSGINTSADGSNVHWNSSSNQGVGWKSSSETTPANQGYDWMSSANTITSTNAFSETAGNQNPFGGNISSSAQHSGIDTSNPFGGGQGGFGQGGTPGQMHGFIQPNQQQPTTGFGHSVQQSGGFGHGQPDRFAQQNSSNTGFGQQSSSNTGFGQPPSFRQDAPAVGGFSQAPAGGFGGWGGGQQQQQQGFGQFPVQNGGFSSATGFGGQTMPTSYGNTMSAPSGQFSDKMGVTGGGFGAFSVGQPGGMQPAASANPFMSAATQQMAPKTNSTNPFL